DQVTDLLANSETAAVIKDVLDTFAHSSMMSMMNSSEEDGEGGIMGTMRLTDMMKMAGRAFSADVKRQVNDALTKIKKNGPSCSRNLHFLSPFFSTPQEKGRTRKGTTFSALQRPGRFSAAPHGVEHRLDLVDGVAAAAHLPGKLLVVDAAAAGRRAVCTGGAARAGRASACAAAAPAAARAPGRAA